MHRAILSVIAAGLLLVATSAAFAKTMLEIDSLGAGDHLASYTVYINADDDEQRPAFFNLTFQRPFKEITFFGPADVPDDSLIYLNDPNYAARQGQDTFFFTQEHFDTGLVGQLLSVDHAAPDTYHVRVGSGHGSTSLYFPLAQVVVPNGEIIRHFGSISRGSSNRSYNAPPGDDPVGVIPPEHGTFLMVNLGLAGLVVFDRRISVAR